MPHDIMNRLAFEKKKRKKKNGFLPLLKFQSVQCLRVSPVILLKPFRRVKAGRICIITDVISPNFPGLTLYPVDSLS